MVRAHQHAAGARRAGQGRSVKGDDEDHERVACGGEALGRSRGGLSSKLHLVADRRCRPIARIITPGQHGDSPRFIPLMDSIRIQRRGVGRPQTPGPGNGRQGLLLARQPPLSETPRFKAVKAVIPVKKDQQANRQKLGSKGGRPRSLTGRHTRNATP